MEWAEAFIRFFKTEITPPKPWGAYHLCCLAAMSALVVLLLVFSGKLQKRPRLVRALTAGIGLVLFAAELLKQVLYGLHIGENGVFWEYPWHIFPFQLCSTPLYVCLALLFMPEGKVRRALCAYLGTFGLFGGLTVMLHPNAVLNRFLFVDIHTMLWHVGLVVLGALQWAGGAINSKAGDFLGASVVFALFVLTAFLLNLCLPQLAEENFNMFYISPYIPCTILLLTNIWEQLPYPAFLAIYVFGFAAISGAIFAAACGLRRAAAHFKRSGKTDD